MINALENWRLFLDYSDVISKSLSDIEYAKTICDPIDQEHFLIKCAVQLIEQKEYNHAAVIAWYILSQIDDNSKQAKTILKEAYQKIFVIEK